MDTKPFFDAARVIAGGKLTQAQVDGLNKVVEGLTPEDVPAQKPEKKTYQLSRVGINMIKGFEGLRLKAYDDGVGVWTIGYGTIKYPSGKRVVRGDTCVEAQAEKYMMNDLLSFEATVNAVVTVPLTQNQYDALVSLTYNIGATAFSKSTLLRKLNAGDVKGAAEQFDVWNKGGGKVMQGLVNRRAAERKVFETK